MISHLLALLLAPRPLGPLGVDGVDVEVEAGEAVIFEGGSSDAPLLPAPASRAAAQRGTALVQRAEEIPQVAEAALTSPVVVCLNTLQWGRG